MEDVLQLISQAKKYSSSKKNEASYRKCVAAMNSLLQLLLLNVRFDGQNAYPVPTSSASELFSAFTHLRYCLNLAESLVMPTSILLECESVSSVSGPTSPSPSPSLTSPLMNDATTDSTVISTSLDSVTSNNLPSLVRTSSSSISLLSSLDNGGGSLVSSSTGDASLAFTRKHRSCHSEADAISSSASFSSSSNVHLQEFQAADDSNVSINPQKMIKLLFESPLTRPNVNNGDDSTSTSTLSRIPYIPSSPLVLEHAKYSRELRSLLSQYSSMQEQIREQCSYDSYQSLRSMSQRVSQLRQIVNQQTLQISHANDRRDISTLHADQIAIQLTLIEWSIFVKVMDKDLVQYSFSGKQPPTIQTSTDFFNYLTRSIEYSILTAPDTETRAHTLHFWIKVSNRLHEFRNYNSLKAVVSGLSTTVVRKRLGRCWEMLPRKDLQLLDQMRVLMSEQDNYKKLREVMGKRARPAIPFLGVVIHDLTYIAAARKVNSNVGDLKLDQVLAMVEYYQNDTSYYSDPKYNMCTSKQHSGASGRNKEKGGGYCCCDPLYCCHVLLTFPYVSEREIDQLAEDLNYNSNPDSTVSSRSASPKKLSSFLLPSDSQSATVSSSSLIVEKIRNRRYSLSVTPVDLVSIQQQQPVATTDQPEKSKSRTVERDEGNIVRPVIKQMRSFDLLGSKVDSTGSNRVNSRLSVPDISSPTTFAVSQKQQQQQQQNLVEYRGRKTPPLTNKTNHF